jgi:deoxycytidylate deaminase
MAAPSHSVLPRPEPVYAISGHLFSAREEIISWAEKNDLGRAPYPTTSVKYGGWLQDLGDQMRDNQDDHAAVAVALVNRIRHTRAVQISGSPPKTSDPVPPDGTPRAYILHSVRHPAEVHLLRAVYGNAFTLIGIVCTEPSRRRRLSATYDDAGDAAATQFMGRDAKAAEKHGQHVSDAFHLADFFIDNSVERLNPDKTSNKFWSIDEDLARLVRLISHTEIVRPTSAETAMHAAYGAQTRSACLSRQVGAALMASDGTIVATGTNEVPKAGGGVYRAGSGVPQEKSVAVGKPAPVADLAPPDDGRCAYRVVEGKRFCSNTRQQNEIAEELVRSVPELKAAAAAGRSQELMESIRHTRIGGLIEFSRAVHAEMEAIMAAGRAGVPTKGTRMCVTTFPCHYCARHLVSAGVDEVQYIEPYPKSLALSLHPDSITEDSEDWMPPSAGGTVVLFRPFTGVAPRMYARAFTKDRELKDGATGELRISDPDWGSPWNLSRISYVQLEAQLAKDLG